ncbi:phage portal protein [Tunturiibacter gelidoferens]|uniref:HK97 family phage portal protein n=1 Tax=Tunturiibacter gelidiferens TaxID=3069689 RepID=A0A9X0U880_9BACT|nr:phage portal protein [Edaphobacter lichenicola]MBB5331792.1 HK97 family phage portal protein [Edaphobacter lichenicola]
MKFQTLGLIVPEKRSADGAPVVPVNNVAAWHWLRSGFESDAGETVNSETALQLPEVYSAVRAISELISSLPLNLVRKSTNGNAVQVDNPIHQLFSAAPNNQTTSVEWLEQLVTNLMTEGNAFSQIVRSVDGTKVIGIYGLPPNIVQVHRLITGALEYRVQSAKGQVVLPENQVLQIKLNSRDGVLGLSPVRQCAQLLGSNLAVARFSARYFNNNSVPPVILKTVGKVKPEDKTKMRRDFEELQSGDSQHRTAVMDQDMDVKVLAFDPQSSQMIETRAFLRELVASVWRIPVWLLGDTSKLTSGNLQELRQDLVTSVLRPLAKRIEAQIYLKILRPIDPTLHACFDFADLLKGNPEQTATAVALGRQWGTLTINESRVIEGRNPIEGVMGDSLLIPVNMAIVSADGTVTPTGNTAPTDTPTSTEGNNNE